MKREELARTLDRQAHVSGAAARDQLDELVHRILESLRGGRPVELPGLGKLVSSKDFGVTLLHNAARHDGARSKPGHGAR